MDFRKLPENILNSIFVAKYGEWKQRRDITPILVISYLIIGLTWIFASDAIVDHVYNYSNDYRYVQSWKGSIFVLFTAAMLYVLLKIAHHQETSLSKRLNEAMESNRDGVWHWDCENDIISVTPGGDIELGWRAVETITDMNSWQLIVHPDDWPEVTNMMESLRKSQADNWVLEQRLRNKDNDWIWYQVKGNVLERVDDGSPALMHGTYHCVHALKQTQTALERKNSALRILVAAYNSITCSNNRHKALSKFVHNIADEPDCPLACIGEIESRQTDANFTVRPVACAGSASKVFMTDRHLLRRTVRSVGAPIHDQPISEPVLSGDLVSQTENQKLVSKFLKVGIRSVALAPIKTHDGRKYMLYIFGASPKQFSEDDLSTYRTIARVLGLILDNADVLQKFSKSEDERRKITERLQKAGLGAISALAAVVEKRDPYTAGHQHRVADLAVAFAEELRLQTDQIEALRIGALIHDIGKIGVPTEILSKPGRLDEAELALIRRHAQIGYDIISNIDFGWPIEKIVHQHHERWNGTGYPQGLKGEEITLEARIVAVADVVESMGTDRPYRKTIPWATVIEELVSGRDSKYDPEVVDAAINVLDRDAASFGLNVDKAA